MCVCVYTRPSDRGAARRNASGHISTLYRKSVRALNQFQGDPRAISEAAVYARARARVIIAYQGCRVASSSKGSYSPLDRDVNISRFEHAPTRLSPGFDVTWNRVRRAADFESRRDQDGLAQGVGYSYVSLMYLLRKEIVKREYKIIQNNMKFMFQLLHYHTVTCFNYFTF